jgi:hypothetical protein
MHAWAEVEHTLIRNGDVGEDEERILDLLNGLAIAGEVALQQLQVSYKKRIDKETKSFQDQFEMIKWFKDQNPGIRDYIRFENLGLVFSVLQIFDLSSPRKLKEALPSAETEFDEWAKLRVSQDNRVDFAEWALTTVYNYQRNQNSQEIQVIQPRQKIFFMVNCINWVLAMANGMPKMNEIVDGLSQIADKILKDDHEMDSILPVLEDSSGDMDDGFKVKALATITDLWKNSLFDATDRTNCLKGFREDMLHYSRNISLINWIHSLWNLGCDFSRLGIFIYPYEKDRKAIENYAPVSWPTRILKGHPTEKRVYTTSSGGDVYVRDKDSGSWNLIKCDNVRWICSTSMPFEV